MAMQVVNGAVISCSFGTAPAALIATTIPKALMGAVPCATILDCAPIANIPPFGMCTSLSNPQVASATAAASGVLTPQPCVPVTTPWAPGSPKMILGPAPALNETSKCNCAYGGVIQVGFPGQAKEQIP